jgi:YegS/Rv2252/BmrU family lipid kinase
MEARSLMTGVADRRVHVVINPASGKDEPILNVLNDVFREHGVAWDASVTHRYGDAGNQARDAIGDGVDLVVAYGGDGTQHEVANAVVTAALTKGRQVPMGILPGGTGNGFAREVGVPRNVRDATVLLCTSSRTRAIDVGRLRSIGEARVDEKYFIQRLYIGVEPEEQTSRELKDRYGVFAYAVSAATQASGPREFQYQVDIEGEALEFPATKLYMVNSGMTGSGFKVTPGYAIDDGLLDCFVLDKANVDTLIGAAARALDLDTAAARRYYRQARSISVKVEPDQPVWADGEYIGRTPVSVDVLRGALSIVVP